jgi:hypothetical protein
VSRELDSPVPRDVLRAWLGLGVVADVERVSVVPALVLHNELVLDCAEVASMQVVGRTEAHLNKQAVHHSEGQ